MSGARLSAPERRAALLEVAMRVFSNRSYRGTTVADIARAAGVTEPIVYRHFGSKRALYLACLAEAWERVRRAWDAALAAEPDPSRWLDAMAQALELKDARIALSSLWLQAFAEATEERTIRTYLKRHVQAVHHYVAEVIGRAQQTGAIAPERNPGAQAWTFIALGLLGAVSRNVGDLLDPDELQHVAHERRAVLGDHRTSIA